MARKSLYASVAAIALTVALAGIPAPASAQQPNSAIQVGAADIGGTVTGPSGPEAGVWVIAETTDLPTKFAKIVVTDDQGATSFLICPRRTTASGCAATGSSTRRRSAPRPARHST